MSEFPKPPQNHAEILGWIADYISPRPGQTKSFHIHQFTINGVTYPFVRDFHFAAVPDPPLARRHDMYAGLYLTRPGDLVFFFQSDPQWSLTNVESRRGLRGIYRVASSPFRDTKLIRDPNTDYQMLGNCPACGTFHSTLGKKCPTCGNEYPSFKIPSRRDPYYELVLASRLELEPLVIFERAVSDERVYADMTDPGMIWVGRHDNQMGPGKGSSIRQLLPEEAIKLVRLMLSEPGQRISFPEKRPYPNKRMPLLNEDGSPAEHLRVHFRPRAGQHKLAYEDSLNFHIARVFDDINSSFVRTLKSVLGDTPWDHLEYVSSMFPWGYTAGTSDFVFAFHNGKQRYLIAVMELKKDVVDDDAFLQVSLYVPWVVQVLSQFSSPPPSELTVVPVVIGADARRNVVRPRAYDFAAQFNSGVKVNVSVTSTKFLRYQSIDVYAHGHNHYARDIEYADESSRLKEIEWRSPKGVVTSQVERGWLRDTSWEDARRRAGLS